MTLHPSKEDSKTHITTLGIVLKSSPIGEYDRRVVVLTKELGKISAFARGARRPTSSLLAATGPFVFGEFTFFAGRDSYTLTECRIEHAFSDLSRDVTKACYGSYFLEFMDYLTREGMDETLPLLLTYASLRALERDRISERLIQSVFELRLIMLEGEWRDIPEANLLPGTLRALSHIQESDLSRLYSFTVNDTVLKELVALSEQLRSRVFPHDLSSLRILKALQ